MAREDENVRILITGGPGIYPLILALGDDPSGRGQPRQVTFKFSANCPQLSGNGTCVVTVDMLQRMGSFVDWIIRGQTVAIVKETRVDFPAPFMAKYDSHERKGWLELNPA